MQGNWKNWRNSIWWSANREQFRENDKKRTSEIPKFSQENVAIFLGGPRTEKKFVKWSASRKRLRTAGLNDLWFIKFELRHLYLLQYKLNSLSGYVFIEAIEHSIKRTDVICITSIKIGARKDNSSTR